MTLKNSKLRDEIVEKEKNMLITCMDLDDTKGEKAVLEREVRIIKSFSNLDVFDNGNDSKTTQIDIDVFRDDVKKLFSIDDTFEFKKSLSSIVQKVINMRCKQQFGVENVNELH